MSAASSTCRFGILSTANIANKVVKAIQDAPNATVVAVASRTQERADAFAKTHGIAHAFGSYEELIASSEVDAVYLPVPTGVRTAWVLRCLQAGKHVLSEKPCAPTSSELDTILSTAIEQGVVYMENVMFMHNRRLPLVMAALANRDVFGDVLRVDSSFAFYGDASFAGNIRVSSELEPLGAVGDLGWYNVRFTLATFGYDVPKSVSAQFHAETNGVPSDATVTLEFEGGRVGVFHCSFNTACRNMAEVSGQTAVLQVPDFTSAIDNSFTVVRGRSFSSRQEQEVTNVELEISQEAQLIANFSDLTRAEDKNKLVFWRFVASLTQNVCDAIMESGRNGGARVEVKVSEHSQKPAKLE